MSESKCGCWEEDKVVVLRALQGAEERQRQRRVRFQWLKCDTSSSRCEHHACLDRCSEAEVHSVQARLRFVEGEWGVLEDNQQCVDLQSDRAYSESNRCH